MAKQEREGASQRFRWGVPLKDADADMIVFVTGPDIEGAVRASYTDCGVARAVCRTAGPTARAEILRTVAHVKCLDEDGCEVVLRFIISPKTSEMIRHFDATGEMNPAGYRLRAPTRGESLDHRLDNQRKRDQVRKDRIGKRRYRSSDPISITGTIRNGSGQIRNEFR